MKKVALAAVLVVAMMLGVVAYASAVNAGTVAVTAKVNPNIAMTIDVTAYDWATTPQDLDVSDVSGSSIISVRSNALWDFTMVPTIDPELAGVISDTYTTAPGSIDIPTGFTDITATYTLDLTDNAAAYQLDPAASYSASYLYTAAQ